MDDLPNLTQLMLSCLSRTADEYPLPNKGERLLRRLRLDFHCALDQQFLSNETVQLHLCSFKKKNPELKADETNNCTYFKQTPLPENQVLLYERFTLLANVQTSWGSHVSDNMFLNDMLDPNEHLWKGNMWDHQEPLGLPVAQRWQFTFQRCSCGHLTRTMGAQWEPLL